MAFPDLMDVSGTGDCISHAPADPRILPMEGLRGFAASLVFFVHFGGMFGAYGQGATWYVPFRWLESFGHTGVDLFFILSGYLIYGIVMRPSFCFSRFFRRRVHRLYPVFIFVFLLYLGLSVLFPERSKIPHGLGEGIGYVLANFFMLPGVLPIEPIITVAWSLSYEWFFYLGLPILVAVLGIRRWPWTVRALFFAAAAAAWTRSADIERQNLGSFAMFASGILIWEIHNRMPRVVAPNLGSLIAALLLFSNLLAIGAGSINQPSEIALKRLPGPHVPVLFVTGLLFTLYASFGNSWLTRVFCWPAFRYMGNISYSYYLIHGITLLAMNWVIVRLVPVHQLSIPAGLLLFVVCYGSTVLLASILYGCIERPFSFTSESKPASVHSQLAEIGHGLRLNGRSAA